MAHASKADHVACHIKHVRRWPLGAKVWIWWGIQGWVPGVVIEHQRSRVRLRIAGPAQSGLNLSSMGTRNHRGTVSRSPNNIVARRGSAFPLKHRPATCLAIVNRKTPLFDSSSERGVA